MSMFREKKPYTAVTVQIDRMTSETIEEDDLSGIPDLIEVIKIQGSGPTEAARALRKKLKYGSPHRQLRALTIMDGLLQNAGARFQRAFTDEPLLERLRLLPRDEVVDPDVRKKCQVLFIQWANEYKDTPGLGGIASLHRELPKSQRPQVARQRVLERTEVESDDERSTPAPSTSPTRTRQSASNQSPGLVAHATSRKPVTLSPATSATSGSSFSSKLSKHRNKHSTSSSGGGAGKPFNLAKEKENMTTTIAQSSIASTNLLNGLQLINREHERVSENAEVVRRFETCKALRRRILAYIQAVESDDWIGSLVNANDELVKALTAYEIMDKSIDDDSDSDAWEHAPGSKKSTSEAAAAMAGLKVQDEPAAPAKPPRPVPREPTPEPEEDEDDDNPFGDSNAVATPAVERSGMTWREI